MISACFSEHNTTNWESCESYDDVGDILLFDWPVDASSKLKENIVTNNQKYKTQTCHYNIFNIV